MRCGRRVSTTVNAPVQKRHFRGAAPWPGPATMQRETVKPAPDRGTPKSIACRVLALALLIGAAIPVWSEPADTSGAVRRGYVSVDTRQIHYRFAAPAAGLRSQPPLVLFHLSPNSSQVFDRVMPLLAADRVVLAPDTPGCGMSDPLPDPQRIEDYAAVLNRALATLVDAHRLDAVGYHTGAGIALEIERQQPGRWRRLALVAVPVLTAEERARGAAIPMIPFDEDGAWAQAEWQRSWRWRGPGQDRESVLATYAAKMRPGARERGAEAILAYDSAAALAEARAELLIVRVRDDLWEATGRAHTLRPDALFRELPDYGHGLFHAAPALMNGLLREFFDAEPGERPATPADRHEDP